MHVLVAFASRHGSTREIAESIGVKLREAGHTVDVHEAVDRAVAHAYDAVILGSGVYIGSWLEGASGFVSRNLAALAMRPVWLFSVGSLSSAQGWPWGSLAQREPRDIENLLQTIHPLDYHVFRGVVDSRQLPLLGRAVYFLLNGRLGDYRDWREIDAWADRIVSELADSDRQLAEVTLSALVRGG